MVAWEEEQEKIIENVTCDEKTRDNLMKESDLPLSIRLYKKGNVALNDQLSKAINANSKKEDILK